MTNSQPQYSGFDVHIEEDELDLNSYHVIINNSITNNIKIIKKNPKRKYNSRIL